MNKKFLLGVFALTLLTGCGSSDKPAAPNSASDSVQESVAAQTFHTESRKPANSIAAIGETVTADGASVTVNSAETLNQADDYNTPDKLDEGKKYELIDVTIENLRDEPLIISSMINFDLKDSDGRQQEDLILMSGESTMDGEIAPGDKLSGKILYNANAEGELVLSVKVKPIGGETVRFQIR